jgi:hypothetical protein
MEGRWIVTSHSRAELGVTLAAPWRFGRSRVLAVTVAAATLLSTGCGGSGPTTPTAPARGPFTISGTATVLDSQLNERVGPATVTALSGSWNGTGCVAAQTAGDGSFVLTVPASCFQDGQPVYLTVAGFTSCTSLPFAAGGHVSVVLMGRSRGTCGMVAKGKAGYLHGTVEPGAPKAFLSTFVGAWGGSWDGKFCTQTLGNADGSFAFEIPESCFPTDGEIVYLTSGGLDACVSIPYRHATVVTGLVLYGRFGGACP